MCVGSEQRPGCQNSRKCSRPLAPSQQPRPQLCVPHRLLRHAWTSTLVRWKIAQSVRTAGCGPACPVVWQGGGRGGLPYADCSGAGIMFSLHKASRRLGVRFLKAAILLLVAQSCLAQSVPTMAADADPTFEVATIKPSQPDEQRSVVVQGTRLVTADTSLVDLMMFAYGVHSLQIVDDPEWLRTKKFDVVVQPSLPGRPSSAQMRSIIQQFLADRF